MPALIAFVVIYLAWAIFSARRKFEKKKVVLNRFSFAVHALFGSQIGFLVIFIGLLVLSAGFILFAAPILVFSNLLVGIFTFLIALLVYRPFIQKSYAGQPQYEGLLRVTIGTEFVKIVISTVSLFGLFFLLNGMSVIRELVAAYAVGTNNAGLVELQKYDFQKDSAYGDIARDTNDLALCDKMSTQLGKAQCYEQSDPDYQQYLQNCTLYTKHGYIEAANWSQRDCITDKYIFERFENGTNIQCDVIAKDFSGNIQIGGIIDRCKSVDKLQDVIKSGVATKCRGFLTEPLSRGYWADSYMACVGNFVGSSEQRSACGLYAQGYSKSKYPDRPPEYLMALGRCPGYEQHEHFGDALDVFRGGTPPSYTETY
jgi:hypothetical protein